MPSKLFYSTQSALKIPGQIKNRVTKNRSDITHGLDLERRDHSTLLLKTGCNKLIGLVFGSGSKVNTFYHVCLIVVTLECVVSVTNVL